MKVGGSKRPPAFGLPMNNGKPQCPLCGRPDAVGNEWPHPNGRLYRTCHGLNRDSHPGRTYHFDAETGDPLHLRDRHDARLCNVLSQGQPASLRGLADQFLFKKCNVSAISAADLDSALVDKPEYGMWAREREREGYVISMLPCMRGADIVGIQFRAFDKCTGDAASNQDNIRNIGESDAIYIGVYASKNPCAVIIHEGPWGAIAANHDADEYGNPDIFSVAILSATFNPETVRSTLDLIFPGVPRFSLFDQDQAGVHARWKAMGIAKPISLMGCGFGKDYRDLDTAFRFESLCEAVRKELKAMEMPQNCVLEPIPVEHLDAVLCAFPMTEYGLADRFVERHGRLCRYVDAWKQWMSFDGKRWARSSTKAEFLAQDVIKRLEQEANHL